MANIGRISGAIAAINNEATAALANINFDFTLLKVEAPPEFTGVGESISQSRKENAENGRFHVLARKLAALFGPLLPQTENLFRAYGKRASDIATARKGKSAGLFATYLGPDPRSLWAAATSGSLAIAVHLLACMLARAWHGPEATSIWVELVAARKQEILAELEMKGTEAFDYSLLVAPRQEISREDLAAWDSSARAWLQTADDVMMRQQKQLMLVIGNCASKVNNENDLYTSVIRAWVTSLGVMENTMSGMSQMVNSGFVFIAISAWHLYPDMSVVGVADLVKQNDPYVNSLGIVTVGLDRTTSESSAGIFWSVPLAHLRYYGKPVRSTGIFGRDNSRLTMDEFSFVILGSVLSTWRGFAKTPNVGVQWALRVLWLLRSPERESTHQHKDLSRMREITSKASWIGHLLDAAERFNDLEDRVQVETARRIVLFGIRRNAFLCDNDMHPPPLFGLSKFSTLFGLLRGPEERITLLRKLGKYLSLSNDQFVIRYFVDRGGVRTCEYTTVFPVGTASPGKLPRWLNEEEEEVFSNGIHIRWLSSPDNAELRCQAIARLGEKPLFIARTPRMQDFRDGKDYSASRWKTSPNPSLPNPGMKMFAGDENSAAIMCVETVDTSTDARLVKLHADSASSQIGAFLNAEFLETALRSQDFNYDNLTRWFTSLSGGFEDWLSGLKAAASAAELYKLLPEATVDTMVLQQSLKSARWIPRVKWSQYSSLNYKLTKEETLACIAMFENGNTNLDPSVLADVFGLSSGNSLFIASQLLCDPHEAVGNTEIRRVTGNIGKAGLSFLLPPPNPAITEPDMESWAHIDRLPYTGTLDDSFQNTSLHLSFTAYEMPLASETDGHLIDRPIRLVETLIQVYDKGRWIADLDVLSALTSNSISRLLCKNVSSGDQACKRVKELAASPDVFAEVFWDVIHPLISRRNWPEFLDSDQGCVRVMHAHDNWLARLALATLSVAQGHRALILPSQVCWSCCKAALAESQSNILIL